MSHKILSLGGLLSIAFLSCSLASAQTPEDTAWNKISTLEQKAYQDFLQEKQVPGDKTLTRKRKQLYRQASFLLDSYIANYGTQFSDEEDLRMLYRRGLYAEYSGSISRAMVYYMACKGSPKIGTTLYNNQLLRAQLEQRLSTSIPYSYSEGHWIFEGKGSIRVVTTIETPNPPSSLQQVEIATGLCAADDPVTAQAIGMRRLARLVPPLGQKYSPSLTLRPGLAVFSVGGTAAENQVLADRLSTMRLDLVLAYFPGAAKLNDTAMLYVYANLLPYATGSVSRARIGTDLPLPTTMKLDTSDNTSIEDLGSALSEAVHHDPMSHLEGYYQPQDNSIVLRKGLRSTTGQWYLGTANHEMVHALMHVDYPNAPLWLDEGMASLHEVMDGKRPLDNYRLYYLLEAINAGRMPELSSLTDSDSKEWKSRQPLMAAMARYLCLYLQQSKPGTNQLKTVYEKMRDGQAETVASPEVFSSMTLHQVTDMEQGDMKKNFTAFIKSRDTTFVDANWGYLREDMRNYILGLPGNPWTGSDPDLSANAPTSTEPKGPVQHK